MYYMIQYFLMDYTLTAIFAVVALVVVIWMVVNLIRHRRKETLRNLSTYIDCIPFLAGLVGVIGFLTQIHSIYNAITSLQRTGSGDPRVAAEGFREFFFMMTIIGGLFFIFMEMWLVVRMIYVSFLHELDTLPK